MKLKTVLSEIMYNKPSKTKVDLSKPKKSSNITPNKTSKPPNQLDKPDETTIDWWNNHDIETQKQWIKDHPKGKIAVYVKSNVLKYGEKYGGKKETQPTTGPKKEKLVVGQPVQPDAEGPIPVPKFGEPEKNGRKSDIDKYFEKTHEKRHEYFERMKGIYDNDSKEEMEERAKENKRQSQKILFDRIKDDKDFGNFVDENYGHKAKQCPACGLLSPAGAPFCIHCHHQLKTEMARHDDLKEGIKKLVGEWAKTSADNSENSLMLQKAVKEEFNLKDVAENHFGKKYKDVSAHKGLKKFVRQMYEETQKQLKENGIPEKLVLFRGIGLKENIKSGEVKTELQAISSFSISLETAYGFAKYSEASEDKNNKGHVLISVIDRGDILSTPMSGFGCTHEKEFVVLGNKKMKTYCININEEREFFEKLIDRKTNPAEIKKFITSKVLSK